MKWINVDDKVPDMDEEVNVWLDYTRRQVATMRYAGIDDLDRHIWFWHNTDERTTLEPKAWMSLPEPPTNFREEYYV